MIKNLLRNKTVGNIGIYSALNFINSAIPFLLLPVLTHKLTKSEFALIDIFNNLAFILSPLVGLNIGAAVIRYYYDKDQYDLKVFFSSALLFLIGSSLLLLAFLFLSSTSIGGLLNISRDIQHILILSVLYSLFNQIGEVLLSLYRASERPVNYGVYRVSKTFLDLGVSTILIVFVWASWTSRVYTALTVSCIFSIIAICVLVKELDLKFTYNKHYVKAALAYSVPLILHNISGYVINYADRLIILRHLDLEAVGLYGVAYQVGMVISFIGNSFNQAWTPFLFSTLKAGNKNKIKWLEKSNVLMTVFYFSLAGIIYLFVPFIYQYFIGKDFKVEPHIVFVVLLGYATNASYKNYVNYLFYYKRTARLSFYTGISALINIGLCWVWVPKYNILGAAYATLVSFIVQFVLVYVDYKKIIKPIQ